MQVVPRISEHRLNDAEKTGAKTIEDVMEWQPTTPSQVSWLGLFGPSSVQKFQWRKERRKPFSIKVCMPVFFGVWN